MCCSWAAASAAEAEATGNTEGYDEIEMNIYFFILKKEPAERWNLKMQIRGEHSRARQGKLERREWERTGGGYRRPQTGPVRAMNASVIDMVQHRKKAFEVNTKEINLIDFLNKLEGDWNIHVLMSLPTRFLMISALESPGSWKNNDTCINPRACDLIDWRCSLCLGIFQDSPGGPTVQVIWEPPAQPFRFHRDIMLVLGNQTCFHQKQTC